jgi:2,3-bisphosphoglycerate-independent phosphoglycerate mutase
VIFQDLERINQDIENEKIRENAAIRQAMEHVCSKGSTLHMQGLLSDGGVHAMQDHWYALISMAQKIGVENLVAHVFTDGRDTPPKSAMKFVSDLQAFMDDLGLGRIATLSGRYYAMDRNNNWDRVEKAYKAIVSRDSHRRYQSAPEALEDAYNRGETDEFMEPMIIEDKKGEISAVGVDDAVIFVNFRSDRAKELTKKFMDDGPVRKRNFVAMTQYDDNLDCQIAYPQETVENTLGEVLSEAGLTQLRISETEKFNHVTYFFNCRKSAVLEGEDRLLLDTRSDIPFDKQPQMRARDITREIVQDVSDNVHDVIIANICNADMIGHTGNIDATVKGVEVVDQCLGEIFEVCRRENYIMIVTADHGNAEEMLYPNGEPETSHSKFPVPFIVVLDDDIKLRQNIDHAGLDEIAPTVLKLLDIEKPKEMTGTSLVAK